MLKVQGIHVIWKYIIMYAAQGNMAKKLLQRKLIQYCEYSSAALPPSPGKSQPRGFKEIYSCNWRLEGA